MKILQLVPYFYPAWAYGGPAKLVYDTSVYFASKKHQVIVYTSDAFDEKQRMPKEKKITNVKNLHVWYFPNIHNTLSYVYNIFFTPLLFIRAFFDIPNIDIIHIHDFYTPQNVWVALLAKLFRKPYVLSVHGCLEEKRVAQRSFFKKVFLFLFGRFLLFGATHVIATSENEVLAYKAYGIPKERIKLFGHGVNAQEFYTSLSKSECRKHFGVPKNKLLITFLGRIHKIKGLDLLIGALAKIKDKNIHCVIAGSNDGYLPELKSLVKQYKLTKRVTLWKTCFGEEKAQLFKATDLFVYPSYSEGFSLGILEAASAGLPLVITKGCHFDAIQKRKAGIVVENTIESLKVGMERFLRSETLRQSYGKHVAQYIHETYSMEAVGTKLLHLYGRKRQI